jgi:methyltransferase family protein
MINDLLKWGGKRSGQASAAAGVEVSKGNDVVVSSKAFPKFVSALSQQPEPTVVIDFGPVIGGNVQFLGERLGCKLFIQDLVGEFDRQRKAGNTEGLAAALEARLQQEDNSVDGVLCWDLFDFLDKTTAQSLAKRVTKMLKPGGAVMGLFCTSNVEKAPFTKYEVVDEQSLRHRVHAVTGGFKQALQNRDIIRMFEGLVVSDSFLLKNNTREILLRKK